MSRAKSIKPENIEFYRILSCNIHYFRESAGIRTADLAARIHITPSYLTALESPGRPEEHGSLEVIFDLSRALYLQPADLFRDMNSEARENGPGPRGTYDGLLLPRNDIIRDAEPWMYDRKFADVVDLYSDDGLAFVLCCIRHFYHRTDPAAGRSGRL